MNILILCCGTRNKIVQYFKKELTGIGRVIATDSSPTAPALYDADKYHVVPAISEEGYIERVLDICRDERISGVFSLIDPELSLLARERERFSRIGVTVIGSSYDLCEMTHDKWKMHQWLIKHGYNSAKTFINKEHFLYALEKGEINYPVVVKPIRGSASLSVHKVNTLEMLEALFSAGEELMIQEFLNGTEIGVDGYVDIISGNVSAIFTKKKLLMRAGETDKAVSFKDEALFELMQRFITECGFYGQIDIDVFNINGKYFISEVNPRFGGGYPHAYECGVNFPAMIINNLLGNVNRCDVGQYEEGVFMMKYNDVMVRRVGSSQEQ